MRAPHLQRGPSGRSSLGAPFSRTPCCFILESARVHNLVQIVDFETLRRALLSFQILQRNYLGAPEQGVLQAILVHALHKVPGLLERLRGGLRRRGDVLRGVATGLGAALALEWDTTTSARGEGLGAGRRAIPPRTKRGWRW